MLSHHRASYMLIISMTSSVIMFLIFCLVFFSKFNLNYYNLKPILFFNYIHTYICIEIGLFNFPNFTIFAISLEKKTKLLYFFNFNIYFENIN